MEQEELIQFVQWLPSKVAEFQDKTPEEIVGALNQMAQSEEGMNTISGLINQFKQEQSTGMFKKGGKINYLINMFRDGGSTKEKRQENKKTVKEGKKSSKFNRTAYRNMKLALKDQDLGLGRRDIKAAAMRNIVGDTNSNIIKQEGNISKPVSFGGVIMKVGTAPKANVSSQVTPDLSQGSFNQAFAAARKGGLSTFNWRGKSYGTQLAQTRPAPSKPNLPNDNTDVTLTIPQAVQHGVEAARGIRPNNMNEELIISSPLYNDYIVMSNLSNPSRFDSRYIAPKKTTTGTGNNTTLGYMPIEHRINPRNLGSFFQEGGKTPKKVGTLNYVQGRTSKPAGMDKLDFNNVFSDGYRASQFSNKKGDILQILQQPNTTNGTERRITNNLQDTTYVITNNGAKYKNKPLPWYNPKVNEENRKEKFNWLTSRFAEYFPIKK